MCMMISGDLWNPRAEHGHARELKAVLETPSPLASWPRFDHGIYSVLLWKQEFFCFSEHLRENGCLKALKSVDHASFLLHPFLKFLIIIWSAQLKLGVYPPKSSQLWLEGSVGHCQSLTSDGSRGKRMRAGQRLYNMCEIHENTKIRQKPKMQKKKEKRNKKLRSMLRKNRCSEKHGMTRNSDSFFLSIQPLDSLNELSMVPWALGKGLECIHGAGVSLCVLLERKSFMTIPFFTHTNSPGPLGLRPSGIDSFKGLPGDSNVHPHWRITYLLSGNNY